MSTRNLQEEALAANVELAARGLAHANFGNAGGVDRDAGAVAIKPSGVAYDRLRVEDISLVSLESGELLGDLLPSSNTPTHLELYRAVGGVGGVAHTHSTYATSWAQTLRPIPCLATTHADYILGDAPCSRALTAIECGDECERMTGLVIVEALEGRDPGEVPAGLVASHGPFAWGASAAEAVEQAAVLERVAELAFNAIALEGSLEPFPDAPLGRHFRRKHGQTAYYGQQ